MANEPKVQAKNIVLPLAMIVPGLMILLGVFQVWGQVGDNSEAIDTHEKYVEQHNTVHMAGKNEWQIVKTDIAIIKNDQLHLKEELDKATELAEESILLLRSIKANVGGPD